MDRCFRVVDANLNPGKIEAKQSTAVITSTGSQATFSTSIRWWAWGYNLWKAGSSHALRRSITLHALCWQKYSKCAWSPVFTSRTMGWLQRHCLNSILRWWIGMDCRMPHLPQPWCRWRKKSSVHGLQANPATPIFCRNYKSCHDTNPTKPHTRYILV